jgi:predicted kinase
MRILIVLTGSSHSGKSTLATSLRVQYPTLEIHELDDYLPFGNETLRPDLVICDSYSVLRKNVTDSLERSQPCVAISTFTFVPRTGHATYYHDEHERLANIAESYGALFETVRLRVTLFEALRRRARSRRLTPWLLTRIWWVERSGAESRQLASTSPDDASDKLHAMLEANAK